MVRSGEAEEAYDYLSKNAKMLRSLMDEANEVTRTLAKEIDFVKDYLKLQELRFKDRYRFILDIDPAIKLSVKIPKMIIHTYVENALKHGLADMREGGILKVQVTKIPHHSIRFEISDNGKGITKSQIEANNGKGLKMMEEYYRLFEKYYGYEIRVSMEKLNPENKENPGTRVLIIIKLPH
jgi:LytS/YehU family sensor histidine kinase